MVAETESNCTVNPPFFLAFVWELISEAPAARSYLAT